MEFSELFSFLFILKESIQILPKIWIYVFSITAISLVLPSAFFLPFSYTYQTLTDSTISTPDSGLKYLAIFFAAEIVFLFAYIAVSQLSGIATIIVSAASYTGGSLSLSDLISRVKTARRRSPSTRLSLSRKSSVGVLLMAIVTAVLIFMDLINPITICLLVIPWIVLIIFQLKESVPWMLAYVVSIVEEGYKGSEAVEKAEQLVEGQILKGFMLNLFINIWSLVGFLVFWLVLGDKGSLNFMIYMFFFINLCSLLRICICVTYTVFYVQCKRLRGEDIDVLGDFQYAKLPTSIACPE